MDIDVGPWAGKDLSCDPAWLGFPPSQTVSASRGINVVSKQGEVFGDADSGAMAEVRNKKSTKHCFSFTPLQTGTYKICPVDKVKEQGCELLNCSKPEPKRWLLLTKLEQDTQSSPQIKSQGTGRKISSSPIILVRFEADPQPSSGFITSP